MIGRTLSHYEITAKLGEGGMGEVWRATDTSLNREVAVKVLPAEMAADPERLERFKREAQAIAALNHPNIVTIHAVEEADEVHLLTMELVEGKSLDQLLPASGLELDRLFPLAIQIADALASAHEKGVVHRDLKPANVMVTGDGRVKVLDFGLAKLAEPEEEDAETRLMTRDGMILGTVPYMSPEQVQAKPVDHRTDIFSLGILLYEMATGRRPFRGDNEASVISAVLRDQPPPVTQLKAELPNHLGRIIQHCLEKDPERRYQSAKDVRNELDQLEAELGSGRPASMLASSAAAARPGSIRPRRWVPAAAVGLLVLVAALVLGWLVWPRAPGDAPAAGSPAADAAALAGARSESATAIAVLPFVDLSPGGDKEYFGDGLAEELINRLARVDGLRVAGRTSSFAFKGRNQDLRLIGESLDVEAIIEGSIRSAGDRVRVTAQLVGVADGFHLWSDTYDRSLSDIFAVQDEISRSIVGALRDRLAAEARLGEVAAGQVLTNDIEAYQLYLKAHHLFLRRTGESLGQAVGLLEQAIERDPDFAQAHAELALIWNALPSYGSDVESSVALARAREAARRALELDPENAVGHTAQGGLYLDERRLIEAETSYRRALESKPDDPTTLLWHGEMMLGAGRLEEAARLLQRAYEIDPALGVVNGWLGHLKRAQGDEPAAVRWMRESERLGWGAADGWIAQTLFEAGLDDEMLEFLERSEAFGASPQEEFLLGFEPDAFLGALDASRSDAERRADILRRVTADVPNAFNLEICRRLNAIDEAFVLLGQSDLSNMWRFLRVWSPAFAELRADPRFLQWAGRIGLVEYWDRFGWPDATPKSG